MQKSQTPYYAAIFWNQLTDVDSLGYQEMSAQMEELAKMQPGFLGINSIRDETQQGVTISYWKDLESLHQWGKHLEHQVAQELGQQKWYQHYRLQICCVEQEHVFEKKVD